jgi:hypothetical protein
VSSSHLSLGPNRHCNLVVRDAIEVNDDCTSAQRDPVARANLAGAMSSSHGVDAWRRCADDLATKINVEKPQSSRPKLQAVSAPLYL